MMKDIEETSRLPSVQNWLQDRKTITLAALSLCHSVSVLHVPRELTLIILLSLFLFFILSTSLSPSSFSAHFFAPFTASSHHFFQC